MTKTLYTTICTTLLLLLALPIQAQQILRSPSQQATFVELYTSEGCSSCPPANRWYSSLLLHPGLWQQVISVAFHVDYWNYLGWEAWLSTPGKLAAVQAVGGWLDATQAAPKELAQAPQQLGQQ
jgi:hypothetical protein